MLKFLQLSTKSFKINMVFSVEAGTNMVYVMIKDEPLLV
jgi:hypothetical protein